MTVSQIGFFYVLDAVSYSHLMSGKETGPLPMGLAIFGAPESGMDWSVLPAGTLLAVAPLLLTFLLCRRQFVPPLRHAGLK